MSRKAKLKDEIVDRMAQMHKEGKTMDEIAQYAGRTKKTCEKYLEARLKALA